MISRTGLSRDALVLLFVLAPFYWLPGVPVAFLSFIRLCLLGAAIALVFPALLRFVGNFRNRSFVIKVMLLTFVAGFYTFAFAAEFELLRIVSVALLFFTVGYVYARRAMPIFVMMKVPALFFAIACLWVVIAAVFAVADVENPMHLATDSALFYKGFEAPYLSSTGFNFGRTGWSISVFFVGVLMFSCALSTHQRTRKLLFYIAGIAAFLSIVTTGSRGGLVYLAIFSVGWGVEFVSRPARRLYFFALLLIFIGIYVVGSEHLRLDFGAEDLTNGRFDGYLVGLNLLKENFFWGTVPSGGYSLFDYGFEYKNIHNAWLNFALTYGAVLTIIAFFSIFFGVIVILRKRFSVPSLSVLKYVMIGGFVSTFFEPHSILSEGHFILMFWVMFGFLLGWPSETSCDRVRSV